MQPLLKLFVRATSINMAEALHPLSTYRTLEELFTRRLKPAARPVSGAVCAPCDGMLTLSQPVKNDSVLQAKGLSYSVSELLGGGAFVPARAVTTYLSPSDYHRVHSPVSGELVNIRYFPGDLWPVNDLFVRLIPQLFVKNERLVLRINMHGGGVVHVVMIGALNVGRMSTPFLPDFVTNACRNRKPQAVDLSAPVNQGDEIGIFMLGSTVVLVFDEIANSRLRFTAPGQRLTTGEPIAQLAE